MVSWHQCSFAPPLACVEKDIICVILHIRIMTRKGCFCQEKIVINLKCYPDQGSIAILENWCSSCLMLSPFAKFQAQIGYNFTLLDIGGGFPGAPDAAITFEEVSYKA